MFIWISFKQNKKLYNVIKNISTALKFEPGNFDVTSTGTMETD